MTVTRVYLRLRHTAIKIKDSFSAFCLNRSVGYAHLTVQTKESRKSILHIIIYYMYQQFMLSPVLYKISFLIQFCKNVISDRCPTLFNPTNGLVECTDRTEINSVATFTCYEGYYLSSIVSRTCLSNETWDNTSPTCNITSKY